MLDSPKSLLTGQLEGQRTAAHSFFLIPGIYYPSDTEMYRYTTKQIRENSFLFFQQTYGSLIIFMCDLTKVYKDG